MSHEEETKINYLDGQPFEKLRVCYFKVYDQRFEKILLDATDEQVLGAIIKIHETARIIKIEEVEVLKVVTHIPAKLKLENHELKSGVTQQEREESTRKTKETQDKIKDYKEKYK